MHFPLHVGLSTAQPDVADKHILPREFLVTLGNDQVSRLSGGRKRCEICAPLSTFRRGGGGLLAKGHGHRLGSVGSAPDRHLLIALQQHVVGE